MATYKDPLKSSKKTYLDPLNPNAKPIEKKPVVEEKPVQQIATAPKKGGFSFDNLLPAAQSGLSSVKNKIDSLNNAINPTVKKAALAPMKTIGKSILNNSPLGMVNNVAKLGGSDLKGMYGLDAMKEYNQTHQNVPTAIKPLGFLMESANRVPLAQRIKVSAGNYLNNPAVNFDGSVMESKTTGNKLLDKTADFAGGLAGQALVGNGQVNMLNATDNIAQYAGSKVGGRILPSLVRGATDAAAGTVLEDIGKGKGLKETAKDTLTNAAFGAGLFGLGKIGSEVLQGRGADLITTSKNTYGSGINKIDNAQARTFKQGDNLVRKEGLPQLPSPRDYSTKVNELPSNNDVIPMGGYKETSMPLVQIKKERIQANLPDKYQYSFHDNTKDINNKTWYHGTGTDNLTSDMLTPSKTNVEGLFGQGIYMTDNPEIARGYAKARSKKTGTPNIYKANVNIDKVLNLENSMPDDAYSTFENIAKNISENEDYPDMLLNMQKLKNKGATGDEIYRQFSKDMSDLSHQNMIPTSELYDYFDELNYGLKKSGYDAYTHVGGKRTGNEAHQVLIMLDPNGELGGKVGQITNFEKRMDSNIKDASLYNNTITSGYQTTKTPVQLPNKPQESVKTNLDINTQAVQNNAPMTSKQTSVPKIVHTEESISKIEDLDELDNVIKQLEDEVAATKDVSKKGMIMNLQLFAQKQKAEVQKKFKTTSNNPITVDNNGVPRAEQKIVSSTKDKTGWKESLKKFYTRVVDTNNPLKPIGDKTYRLATNSKSVGGTVDYILQDGLVDRNGKKIGESLKTLVEDIPKKDYNDFWEYALQRHNIGRADQGKNVFPQFDSTASASAVAQWEKVHPEWKGKADNFVKWIDGFMNEWGVKSGITDKGLYYSLREMYPNYLPTNRAFDDIEEFVPPSVSKKGFVNQKTPLKKATGSERDIIDPVENIMNLVNRTVRTARYNEVGQSLLKEVRKNPDNLVDIAEIVKGEVNPNLKNIVTVMQDGEPINLQINDKSVLEALQSVYKNTGDDVDNAVKKATNLFKTLITQKNPVFALRNIARDVPTAYINGSERNPLKFGLDLLSAGKDLVSNSPTAQQYRALGGGGANFFNSDNVAKSAKELTSKNPLKKIGGAIETFNNVTESAPRLAEFKRTVKKTGDLQQGLFAANDVTTNFSRGGDITKKFDAYVPYLNAGVQGMDKLARQFVNKPIATVLKGATAITAPTLILDHFNKNNKDYKELDQRTKDNYFLIPNGETFIKIPKSRELGVVFSTLTERLLNAARGEEDAFKGFKTTLGTNFSPTNPIENNIFSPLAYNIPKNADFAGRAIVPMSMQDRSPQYQYDEATTEIAKKLGELTGKSPKQIDYLIKAYTGVIGQLLQPATTKINYASGNALEKTLKPITTQFVADPLYSNKTLNEFYENYDKLKTSAADKNFAENVPSKKVTNEEALRNKYAKASKDISTISKQIKELEKSNDKEKIRELRRKMISIAESTNKLNK